MPAKKRKVTNRTREGRREMARRHAALAISGAKRKMRSNRTYASAPMRLFRLRNEDVDARDLSYETLTDTPIVVESRHRFKCRACGDFRLLDTKDVEVIKILHRAIFLCTSCR